MSDAGVISWEGRRLFLSTVLSGEVAGLKERSEAAWELYFGPMFLGLVDSSRSELRLIDAAPDERARRDECDDAPF